MNVYYGKFWQMCVEHDIKPSLFSSNDEAPYYISKSTLYEMRKGHPVALQVIDKICSYFKCQPCDVMEFRND